MKVLMVNHPGTLKFRGGDLTQMRKTAESLKLFGVETAESFDPRPDGRGFDIAHVFNMRTIDSTLRQVRTLHEQGLPIVLSPIYLNVSVTLWANRLLPQIFANSRTDNDLEQPLARFRDRKLLVKDGVNGTLGPFTQNRSQPRYDDLQRQILSHVDYLLPNSHLEIDALVKTLRVTDLPFSIVPYAADPEPFLGADPGPFIKRFGIKDFVLQVGRIEASKNPLMLAYALRKLDVPLVLIGGQLNENYVRLCHKFGPKKIKIFNHMNTTQLACAYAAARVHALTSWFETCGIVHMEAALADCAIVASLAGYEIEYFGSDADYCDPGDETSIRKAVESALNRYDADAHRRDRLRRKILSEYTWPHAAELTLRAYHEVLNSGRRNRRT